MAGVRTTAYHRVSCLPIGSGQPQSSRTGSRLAPRSLPLLRHRIRSIRNERPCRMYPSARAAAAGDGVLPTLSDGGIPAVQSAALEMTASGPRSADSRIRGKYVAPKMRLFAPPRIDMDQYGAALCVRCCPDDPVILAPADRADDAGWPTPAERRAPTPNPRSYIRELAMSAQDELRSILDATDYDFGNATIRQSLSAGLAAIFARCLPVGQRRCGIASGRR
jgi:hypothetical protein